MQNTLLYTAFTTDEIHECSYSLLKYLDIYNVKPPPTHSVVIYTNDPASLEAYSSYFSNFELKDLYEKGKGPADKLNFIREFCSRREGNILYLSSAAYPVKELDPLFASMSNGAVYLSSTRNEKNGEGQADLSVLGFSSSAKEHLDSIIEGGRTADAKTFIETYQDLKEFRHLLNRFFGRYQEESIPNQVKLMHPIDAKKIREQKMQFMKLPAYTRVIRKVLGTGWTISSYTKKI